MRSDYGLWLSPCSLVPRSPSWSWRCTGHRPPRSPALRGAARTVAGVAETTAAPMRRCRTRAWALSHGAVYRQAGLGAGCERASRASSTSCTSCIGSRGQKQRRSSGPQEKAPHKLILRAAPCCRMQPPPSGSAQRHAGLSFITWVLRAARTRCRLSICPSCFFF